MAWMNQEKKAKIAAELKKVVPKTWKYSLSVNNHSTIVMTIKSAPVDLIAETKNLREGEKPTNFRLNHYYLDNAYDGELLATFEAIKAALNTDNFDNSDVMTDYFHVGHYIEISLGKWSKPFEVK